MAETAESFEYIYIWQLPEGHYGLLKLDIKGVDSLPSKLSPCKRLYSSSQK